MPYLSPELTGERLLVGANFASAGIGILNDTGIQFVRLIFSLKKNIFVYLLSKSIFLTFENGLIFLFYKLFAAKHNSNLQTIGILPTIPAKGDNSHWSCTD